jgi:hypothetical protein
MQSFHLNLLSVAGLGDFIIVRLLSYLAIPPANKVWRGI